MKKILFHLFFLVSGFVSVYSMDRDMRAGDLLIPEEQVEVFVGYDRPEGSAASLRRKKIGYCVKLKAWVQASEGLRIRKENEGFSDDELAKVSLFIDLLLSSKKERSGRHTNSMSSFVDEIGLEEIMGTFTERLMLRFSQMSQDFDGGQDLYFSYGDLKEIRTRKRALIRSFSSDSSGSERDLRMDYRDRGPRRRTKTYKSYKKKKKR